MNTDITELKKRQEHIVKEADEAYELAKLSHLLPKPKGVFTKKCPKCGLKLLRKRWYDAVDPLCGGITITLYWCNCGYRYGKLD
jgi:hypothetical protein